MHTFNDDDFNAFLSRLAAALGMDELVPDGNGLIGLRLGTEEPVHFYAEPDRGRIVCFTEVTVLPADAPVSVFRALMAAGLFGTETAGGWFSLEPESNTVVYTYPYDFDPMSAEVRPFAEILGCVLDLSALWRSRIGTMLADAAGFMTVKDEDGLPPA